MVIGYFCLFVCFLNIKWCRLKSAKGRAPEGRIQEGYECRVLVTLYPKGPARRNLLLAVMCDTCRVLPPRKAHLCFLCAEFYWGGSITYCLDAHTLVSSCPEGPANNFSHQFLRRLELIWRGQSPVPHHNLRHCHQEGQPQGWEITSQEPRVEPNPLFYQVNSSLHKRHQADPPYLAFCSSPAWSFLGRTWFFGNRPILKVTFVSG